MDAATFPPTAPLSAKLRAFARLVEHGSSSRRVRELAAAAVRSHAGDRWLAFGSLYRDLLARAVRLPDPGHDAGYDRLEPAEVTLARMAGDCDDWTIVVASIARALGFRAAVVTLSAETPDGLYPLHVYAAVHHGAELVPADAHEGLPLGVDPAGARPELVREVWNLDEPGIALGFLDVIAGAVASIFTSKAQRAAARDQRAGLEAQAAATRDAADSAARAQIETARVSLAAVRASERATEINARLRVRDQDAEREAMRGVLEFLREALPAVLVVAGLKVAMPVVEAAAGVR